MRIFNEKDDVTDTEETEKNIISIDGEIEFKNVSFRYGAELEDVLKDISFKIPKGETIAIVGQTGSGKSSIINLIPRIFDATGGEILIDGVNIKQIPKSILRKNIGLVSQETFLFSDSLLNNIGYGLNKVNAETIAKVSEISQLKKDIDSFSNGLETILGERGITLSGGQKQRSSLARALAINPNILILDDSFSAVDTHTEEEILVELKDFMKGRTSIIISHRISTVKHADNILVLQNGSIAESGNHNVLVQQNGIYADLHNKQLLEEELEELE